MINSKLKAYFNLLKRSCKIIYGYDNIKVYKKKAYLIIFSENINNSEKIIDKAKQLNCKLYYTKQENLNELVGSTNCKIILIKSYELAKAILQENQNINLLREVNYIESNTKQ